MSFFTSVPPTGQGDADEDLFAEVEEDDGFAFDFDVTSQIDGPPAKKPRTEVWNNPENDILSQLAVRSLSNSPARENQFPSSHACSQATNLTALNQATHIPPFSEVANSRASSPTLSGQGSSSLAPAATVNLGNAAARGLGNGASSEDGTDPSSCTTNGSSLAAESLGAHQDQTQKVDLWESDSDEEPLVAETPGLPPRFPNKPITGIGSNEYIESALFPLNVDLRRIAQSGNASEEDNSFLCGVCLLDLVEDSGFVDDATPKEEAPDSGSAVNVRAGPEDKIGLVSCCHHIFHGTCIARWARVENTCALCKQRFGILAFYDYGGKRIRWIPVRKTFQSSRAQSNHDGDDEATRCQVCRTQGDVESLIQCTEGRRSCDTQVHWYCLNLEERPRSWKCSDCASRRSRRARSSSAAAASRGARRDNFNRAKAKAISAVEQSRQSRMAEFRRALDEIEYEDLADPICSHPRLLVSECGPQLAATTRSSVEALLSGALTVTASGSLVDPAAQQAKAKKRLQQAPDATSAIPSLLPSRPSAPAAPALSSRHPSRRVRDVRTPASSTTRAEEQAQRDSRKHHLSSSRPHAQASNPLSSSSSSNRSAPIPVEPNHVATPPSCAADTSTPEKPTPASNLESVLSSIKNLAGKVESRIAGGARRKEVAATEVPEEESAADADTDFFFDPTIVSSVCGADRKPGSDHSARTTATNNASANPSNIDARRLAQLRERNRPQMLNPGKPPTLKIDSGFLNRATKAASESVRVLGGAPALRLSSKSTLIRSLPRQPLGRPVVTAGVKIASPELVDICQCELSARVPSIGFDLSQALKERVREGPTYAIKLLEMRTSFFKAIATESVPPDLHAECTRLSSREDARRQFWRQRLDTIISRCLQHELIVNLEKRRDWIRCYIRQMT